eukprot:GEMP01036926.1.p1 GENE.GEMP01036926.1~~GEMP01036926.1.p1  ORF type:complete len:552 (+),score=117.90 GEMP01036926.1:340-1995(+)
MRFMLLQFLLCLLVYVFCEGLQMHGFSGFLHHMLALFIPFLALGTEETAVDDIVSIVDVPRFDDMDDYIRAMSAPDLKCALVLFLSPSCDLAELVAQQLVVARKVLDIDALFAVVDIHYVNVTRTYGITKSPTLLYFPIPSIPTYFATYSGPLAAGNLAGYVKSKLENWTEFDLLEDFVSEVEDSDLAPIPFTLVAALDDSAPAEAATVLAEDASLAALSEGCGIDVAVIVVRKSRAEAALWRVVASKTALSDMVRQADGTQAVQLSLWYYDDLYARWKGEHFQRWCTAYKMAPVPVFDSAAHYFDEDIGYDLILLAFAPCRAGHPAITNVTAMLTKRLFSTRAKDSRFEKVLPVIVAQDSRDFAVFSKHWTIRDDAWTIGALFPLTQRRYDAHNEDNSTASIWSFAQNILDGHHTPTFRYDPVDASIKCLENGGVNRLVLVIVPWCSFCLHFISGAWSLLKKTYSGASFCLLSDVEHPMIPAVQEFPSLFFFPANVSSAQQAGHQYPWDSEHSVDAVIRWINDILNGTITLHKNLKAEQDVEDYRIHVEL